MRACGMTQMVCHLFTMAPTTRLLVSAILFDRIHMANVECLHCCSAMRHDCRSDVSDWLCSPVQVRILSTTRNIFLWATDVLTILLQASCCSGCCGRSHSQVWRGNYRVATSTMRTGAVASCSYCIWHRSCETVMLCLQVTACLCQTLDTLYLLQKGGLGSHSIPSLLPCIGGSGAICWLCLLRRLLWTTVWRTFLLS